MSFDLNQHMARLLLNEPFFASLSRKINKVENRSVPTAGVRITEDGRFEMVYNPEFFESLPDEQRLGVLKHEFYHLVFEHVTTRRIIGVDFKIQNIAMDLAINSHLRGQLPELACMPGVGPFKDYPAGLSFEAYLAMIQEDQEEREKSKDGEGEPQEGGDGSCGSGGPDGELPENSFDDHDGWSEAGDVSDDAKAMAAERLKQDLKEAATESAASGQGWGSVPKQVQRDILERLKTVVDWRKVLRYFVKTSQRAHKRSSVKRINKRYAYIHPGKKIKRTAKIAIAIDQSGSVNDEMLTLFFSELNSLAKLAEFTVIPFDTRVAEDKVYTWKKGKRRATERVSCGGTDFNCVADYTNGQSFDGLIMLTDMEAPKPKATKAQRMWITTQACAERPYFKTNERVIAIRP